MSSSIEQVPHDKRQVSESPVNRRQRLGVAHQHRLTINPPLLSLLTLNLRLESSQISHVPHVDGHIVATSLLLQRFVSTATQEQSLKPFTLATLNLSSESTQLEVVGVGTGAATGAATGAGTGAAVTGAVTGDSTGELSHHKGGLIELLQISVLIQSYFGKENKRMEQCW